MTDEMCVVCSHVFNGERPVKILIHSAAGGWRAVCGGADHEAHAESETALMIDMSALIQRQPHLSEVGAVGPGELALWRNGAWNVDDADNFSDGAERLVIDAAPKNSPEPRSAGRSATILNAIGRIASRFRWRPLARDAR